MGCGASKAIADDGGAVVFTPVPEPPLALERKPQADTAAQTSHTDVKAAADINTTEDVAGYWKKKGEERRKSIEMGINPDTGEMLDVVGELRAATQPPIPKARLKAKMAWKKVSGMSSVIKDGLVRIKADQMLQDFTKNIGIVEAFADRLPRSDNPKNIMEGVESLTEEMCNDIVQGMTEGLSKCLWQAVKKLADEKRQKQLELLARTGSHIDSENSGDNWMEDNEKFAEASYGDIEVFFQGLDGRIGLPSHKPMEGMMDEHCHQADSNDEFVTANYGGTRTSPSLEWEMVHHPQEGKRYPGLHRNAVPLGNFLMSPEAKAAGLTLVEVCALRLYTGPMYMKYNAVLRRGPDEKVQGLKGNSYTTTLHAICSGVIKLGRVWSIPPSRRVFRGVSGLVLPPNFWSPDSHGCCGGVELGLMSTTTKREVATHYSMSKEGMLATIIEVEVGQIDRGASLTFLSQYPGEEEVLLPPLSNLEVVGKPRMEHSGMGTTVVIPCRINCNLKTLTMDELVGRRKIQMVAMQRNLMQETRLTLVANIDWKSDVTIDYMLEPFKLLLFETEETQPDKFNDDAFFRDAVNRSLNLKVGTEKKWKLLHDTEVAGSPDLRERVMRSAAVRFAENGFIYVLRSGTDQVPFSTMIAGDLDVIAVPSLTNDQAAVMWECVLEHCKDIKVAVVAEGGKGQVLVKASEILTAESVTVSGRKIDPGQINTFSSGHRFNRKLVTLSITNCYIRDQGCTALAQNMQHCTWLQGLDIGENAIGPAGCRVLSDTVGMQCTGLTSLRLAWNAFGVEGYRELSGLFKRCDKLKSVDLSFTVPCADSIEALSDSLSSTSLTNLEFAVCPMVGNRGLAALAKVVEKNVNLTRLDISRVGATAEGLCVLLRSMQHLTKLIVTTINEEAKGMDHPELQSLFAQIVSNNPALKSIVFASLNQACISMKACNHLQRLFITDNYPTGEYKEALAEVLAKPTLRILLDGGSYSHRPVRHMPRQGHQPGIQATLEYADSNALRLNPDMKLPPPHSPPTKAPTQTPQPCSARCQMCSDPKGGTPYTLSSLLGLRSKIFSLSTSQMPYSSLNSRVPRTVTWCVPVLASCQ
mmetsp:Transcript_32511/g.75742  ORF Transcript_32511/g.75742 Transcript_32511/m.75742 type:complete len:1094 (-) Transcript_32511:948-4229(-)